MLLFIKASLAYAECSVETLQLSNFVGGFFFTFKWSSGPELLRVPSVLIFSWDLCRITSSALENGFMRSTREG